MATDTRDPHRVRDGVLRALPLGPAVLVEGIAFGLLARAAGIAPAIAVTMSGLVYSASAQLGALSVVTAGGSAGAAGLAAFLLNLRSLPIGLSLASLLRGSALRRAAEAQLVTDETWALSRTGPGRYSRRLLLGAAAVTWCSWVGGTAIGSLGAALGSPRALGLDVVVPAAFLALLGPQLRDRGSRLPAVLGAAVTTLLVPVAPAGVPLAAAALVPVALAARERA